MNYLDYFRRLLKDRKNPYQIDLELIIRKILEKNISDYTFEFQKNDDPYGYDIESYKYYIWEGGKYHKELIAYIEVEISEKWKDEWLSYWKVYSFVARKILVFKDGEFIKDKLKEGAEKTIYLIFNKSFTDCFCCEIKIIKNFEFKHVPLTGNYYNDCFLRIGLSDERVVRGIEDSMEYIERFLNELSLKNNYEI